MQDERSVGRRRSKFSVSKLDTVHSEILEMGGGKTKCDDVFLCVQNVEDHVQQLVGQEAQISSEISHRSCQTPY